MTARPCPPRDTAGARLRTSLDPEADAGSGRRRSARTADPDEARVRSMKRLCGADRQGSAPVPPREAAADARDRELPSVTASSPAAASALIRMPQRPASRRSSGRSGVSCSRRSSRRCAEASFAGDRSYIQRLAEQVARGEEIDRTGVDTNEAMAVELGFDGLGHSRPADPRHLRRIAARAGREPGLAPAAARGVRAGNGGGAVPPPGAPARPPARFAAPGGGSAGDARCAGRAGARPLRRITTTPAPAAELIDVFENVTELCPERWPIRMAVIVSAWD